MIVKVTDEAGSFRMEDLIEHLKKTPTLMSGAVFTFEGIVRVDDKKTEKLVLRTLTQKNPEGP